MFKKVLIANRGEIAVRILSACKELGIKTVAIFSLPDRGALHARYADEAVCIGPAEPSASYLNIPAIISAANITRAEAIHPGYGFLSENAEFSAECSKNGFAFVGPTSESLRLLGDKKLACITMAKMGLPVLPGAEFSVDTKQQRVAAAERIGFPLMVKSCHGGGGRGLRVVKDMSGLEKAWSMSSIEATAGFGSDRLYLEKYLVTARHIEFQFLADESGNVLHLGERECSIQYRHQKLIEESPSVAISQEDRETLSWRINSAAKDIGYRGAGTFEFVCDGDNRFYFLEVNPRLQVEHPVTEMVTGIDIVKEQIRIAFGDSLSWKQQDIEPRGHSIECRVNAENPATFMPSTGVISMIRLPGGEGPGVRVDSACEVGTEITPYYDSLVAKIITHGRNRSEAIARMRRALETAVIKGVDTTIPFHLEVLDQPDFLGGDIYTDFVHRMIEQRARRSR